jgi:hypothetical protein
VLDELAANKGGSRRQVGPEALVEGDGIQQRRARLKDSTQS